MSLSFKFDENLHEVPLDPKALKTHIEDLENLLKATVDKKAQVRILGEIGTYLRCLKELDLAEKTLLRALQIVNENNLGDLLEIQQKIRLAHVLQWQKKFKDSNLLFSEIISKCRNKPQLNAYLDFALQHAGKNFFDQNQLIEALAAFSEALELRKLRKAPPDQIESTELAIQVTKKLLE